MYKYTLICKSHVNTYRCVYTHQYIYVYIYMYINIYIYIHVYRYIYVTCIHIPVHQRLKSHPCTVRLCHGATSIAPTALFSHGHLHGTHENNFQVLQLRPCREMRRECLCLSTQSSDRRLPAEMLQPSQLQCVAVCCSVLQCVEVCCSVLQLVAVSCSVLQCIAVCCSVMQCVAVCCSVLQCVAVSCCQLLCVVVCCSVLQCVAVCCSVFF